jgi:hypothetical protein
MTDITVVLTCECTPGKIYPNNQSLKRHFQCQRHQNYEIKIQEKDHRIDITKLQIEYDRLKRENEILREMYLNCAKENCALKELLQKTTD